MTQFQRDLVLSGRSDEAAALGRAYFKGGNKGLLRAQLESNPDFEEAMALHAILDEKDLAFAMLYEAYRKHDNLLDLQEGHLGKLVVIGVTWMLQVAVTG